MSNLSAKLNSKNLAAASLGLLAVATFAVRTFDLGYSKLVAAHVRQASVDRTLFVKVPVTNNIEQLSQPAIDIEQLSLPMNDDVFGFFSETQITGYLENPLSKDHDPVKNRIPQLLPAMYTNMTNIAGGMRVGIEEMLGNPRDDGLEVERYMVLMTDGHANVAEPPETDPKGSIDYYANMALANNIIIHGITLGAEADEQSIQEVVNLTGGEYRHVPDDNFEQLMEVFREIGLTGGRAKLVR